MDTVSIGLFYEMPVEQWTTQDDKIQGWEKVFLEQKMSLWRSPKGVGRSEL